MEREGFSANGIDVETKREVHSDFACAGLFYLAIFAQVIAGFIILGSKNSEVLVIDNGRWTCPASYVPSSCESSGPARLVLISFCVNEGLCSEIRACTSGRPARLLSMEDANLTAFHEHVASGEFYRRLAAETGPASQARLLERELAVRRLQNSSAKPASGLWDFLEGHVYQPVALLSCAVVLSGVWLLFLAKASKAAVWGSIVFDVVALIAVFVWYLVDFNVLNWPCIIMAAVVAVGAAVMYKQINRCAFIVEMAMKGLSANKRIFAVSAGVQLVRLGYLSFFIACIVGMHFVKEVRQFLDPFGGHYGSRYTCELVAKGWVSNGAMTFLWTVGYYWAAFFLDNIVLMLVTANLTGWYFKQEGFESFWVKALPWTVWQQGGGNAIASAIMGGAQYLLDRVGNKWKMVFSLLGPWNWILLCIGCCLQTVLEAYTQFALIAMTYSGKSFCQAAGGSLELLKDRLGTAVLTSFIGKDVMAWACYMVSLAVGFAAWAWADDLQGYPPIFSSMDTTLLIVTVVGFVYFLAHPFVTLCLVVLVEPLVSSGLCGVNSSGACSDVVARITSALCALLLSCLAMFILQAVSHVVVSAMNVIFFCFAVEDYAGQTQERFNELYENIKTSVVAGIVVRTTGAREGVDVVVGSVVAGERRDQPRREPAELPNVVGHPVNNQP